VTKYPGEGAVLGFSPLTMPWNHTKTVELIEMSFGLIALVVPRYHVLDGGPDPLRGMGNF